MSILESKTFNCLLREQYKTTSTSGLFFFLYTLSFHKQYLCSPHSTHPVYLQTFLPNACDK